MIGEKRSSKTRSPAIIAALLLSLAAVGLGGCAAGKGAGMPTGTSAGTRAGTGVQGPRFSLDLEPGKTYKAAAGWFIFRYPVYPQVAVWVESLDGAYLGTIYVTGKVERKNWIAAPASGRPEALPVWGHLDKERLDGVSAATAKGRTLKDADLAARLPPGEYVVMLETNRSYDYNSKYTKAGSGVNGQPSLVYRARIQVGKGPASAVFEPIGVGSADGRDGSIRPSLEGIDTALELFSALKIAYKE